MTKQYLTKERLEELKKELEELKTVKRLEVADRLKAAKELGDLSENSEYFEAREEQNQLENKIFELEESLKEVEIIEKGPTKTFTVQIGSTVEVEKNGEKMKFTIVGSNESKPEMGYISNESPLGRAFFNKKAGDKAIVTLPNGRKTEYKIVSIE